MMKNERMLVSRVALLGDRQAFNQLVEHYQSPIRRFLFNLTGDEERGKDLAQETFLKAWLHIGSFRSVSRFSTWLYRIAYNTFYDSLRSRKPVSDTDVVHLRDRLAAENGTCDLSLDLAQALQVLREEERTAMLLFYLEDQSVEKISSIMHCPGGTVKSHLSRGKKKMAAYLEKAGYGTE